MAKCSPPFPVKYFIAIMFHSPNVLKTTCEILITKWGSIDYTGEDHLFDVTNYYEPEMGTPLLRRLISFENLMCPTVLIDMKLACNHIENELAINGKRTVNLDAGYLDHNKVLLASAKEAGQKVYLDKGIYADLSGRYKNGKYQPFEWSFPDFKDGRYDKELLTIRQTYREQLKIWRSKN